MWCWTFRWVLIDTVSFPSQIFQQWREFRFPLVLIGPITGIGNNRKETMGRNSFCAAMKGFFFLHCYRPHCQVQWSTVSFHISWYTRLHQDQPAWYLLLYLASCPDWLGGGALGLPFCVPAPHHFASMTSESPAHLLPSPPHSSQAGPASRSPGCQSDALDLIQLPRSLTLPCTC